MGRDQQPLARARGLEVTPLGGRAEARQALEVVAETERARGVPPVDESERARLETAAGHGPEAVPGPWRGVLARGGAGPVGYGGIRLPGGADPDVPAAGDVAVPAAGGAAVTVLLEALGRLARGSGAARLEVWLRRAGDDDLAAVRAAGFEPARRLAVLGRDVSGDLPAVEVPTGLELRGYRPGADDAAVAGLLADAYAGTGEAGWDVDRLTARRDYDWFRAEDLLLLEGGDGLAGLHWTKRRGGGVGEVYNLAVAPRAQGRGLGAVLLRAGLRHLAAVGCGEVLLWVDRANEPAVALYRGHGFTTRWEDVMVSRDLDGRASAGSQ